MRFVRALVILFVPLFLIPAHSSGLSLEEAVRLAIERNERAHISNARSEAADARVARARAFFFPDLTATVTYTRRAQETFRTVDDIRVPIQRLNAFSPTGTLSLNLFDPRSIPLYRQARRERDAVHLSAAEEKRLLALETADAFYKTLSAERVSEASERRLEFARKSLADARARFQVQIVSSNDVTRAELEVATAEREATSAHGDVEIAYLQLGYLLDTPVTGPLVLPAESLDSEVSAPDNEEGLIARAQDLRLDVAAGRSRASALHLSAQEALLRALPGLRLNAQYRITNEGGLSNRTRDWFASVIFTWDLYDGGERYAERAERRALATAADLDVRALERQTVLDVRTALVALSSARATRRQARVAVDVARQNADQAAELYRQGLASALEAADANVSLFESEVALARAQYGLALALLDLRAALGLDPFGKEPE